MAAQQPTDAISFIGLIAAYGYFVYGVIAAGIDQEGLAGQVIGFYVVTAVVMALVQVLAAWVFGEAPKADREAEYEIGRRSGRNAYVALLSVLWAVPFLLVLSYGVELTLAVVVGVMGLGEVVRYGSRLVYRGLGAGRNQRALTA